MSGRRARQIAVLATLVMASLAASHELIYLLAHGVGVEYARAMQEGGHDRYWTSFVLTVAVVTVALAVVGLRQIRRLSRQASLVRTGRMSVDDRGLGLLARLTARLWLLVAAATLFAFWGKARVVQVEPAGLRQGGYGDAGDLDIDPSCPRELGELDRSMIAEKESEPCFADHAGGINRGQKRFHRPSEANIGESRGPVRVVLDEDDPIKTERERLVEREWLRQLRSWIDHHGVTDLGKGDRVATGTTGEELPEDRADLVTIGAHGRPVVVLVS